MSACIYDVAIRNIPARRVSVRSDLELFLTFSQEMELICVLDKQ